MKTKADLKDELIHIKACNAHLRRILKLHSTSSDILLITVDDTKPLGTCLSASFVKVTKTKYPRMINDELHFVLGEKNGMSWGSKNAFASDLSDRGDNMFGPTSETIKSLYALFLEIVQEKDLICGILRALRDLKRKKADVDCSLSIDLNHRNSTEPSSTHFERKKQKRVFEQRKNGEPSLSMKMNSFLKEADRFDCKSF